MATDVSRLVLAVDSRQVVAGQRALKGMSDSARTLTRVLGPLIALLGARELINYTNQWTDLNSRLVNAVKSHEAANVVMKEIEQTARRTYSSVQQTSEAFLNNAMTLTELGYSYRKQLDLSDALNNSLVISGTKGERAASVMNAFSKALAFGELRGENFNTVIQSGGRMVEALATGLGKSTLELRAMAESGELTTERVVDALTSQMDKLREEADAMPATIGDGMLLIGNAIQSVVGRFSELTDANGSVSAFLVDFADRISAAGREMTAMFESGQIAEYTKAAAEMFVGLGQDIEYTMKMVSEMMRITWNDMIGDTTDATSFFADSFKNIIPNIRAFIQIIVVEIASLVDKVSAGMSFLGDAMNPKNWLRMGDVWKENKQQIEALDAARLDSIESILAEADATITAADAHIQAGEKVRMNYERQKPAVDAANNALLESVDVLKKIGIESNKRAKDFDKLWAALFPEDAQTQEFMNAMTLIDSMFFNNQISETVWEKAITRLTGKAKDAGEEIGQSFDDMANRVGEALRDLVSGGEIDDFSKAFSGIVVGEFSAQMSKAVADMSAQSLGSMAGPFGAIVGSLLGGILGGLFGGGNGNPAATAGRGTVLGDSAAQSESIVAAIEALTGVNVDQYGELKNITGELRRLNGSSDSATDALVRNNDLMAFIASRNGLSGADRGISVSGGTLGNLSGTMAGVFRQGTTFGENGLPQTVFEHVINQSLTDAFVRIGEGIADSMRDVASIFGVSVDEAMQNIAFDLGNIELQGLSPDEINQQIGVAISAFTDTVAEQLFGDVLAPFQKAGEGMAETAIRVATGLTVFKDALNVTGNTLSAITLAMSESIIEEAGGIQELQNLIEGYADKFMSESEKLGRAFSSLNAAFSGMGMLVPASADAYRDLVSAQDLSTEAGQQNYIALLQMADSMDYLFSTIESWRESINSSTQNMIELVRTSMMTDQQLYEYRRQQANELATLIETMTDPEQIANTVSQIEQLYNEMWNSLDPSQREGMSGQFISFAEDLEALAQQQIDAALAGMEEAAASPEVIMQAATDSIQTSAATFESAAQAMQTAMELAVQAANGFQQAANTPINVTVGTFGGEVAY